MSIKELFKYIINFDLKKIINLTKILFIFVLANAIIIMILFLSISMSIALYGDFMIDGSGILLPALILFILLLISYLYFINKFLIDRFVKKNKNKFMGIKILKIVSILISINILIYVFIGDKNDINNENVFIEEGFNSEDLQIIIDSNDITVPEGKIY